MDDKRFQAENYVASADGRNPHGTAIKNTTVIKSRIKRKKRQKIMPDTFQDYLERKAKENMETKKDAANSRVRIIICLIVAIIAIIISDF